MFIYRRHIPSPEKALSGIYSLRRSYTRPSCYNCWALFQQCVTTSNPARASTVSIKTLDILSLPRRCRLGRNHERSLDMLNRRCYRDITKNEVPIMQLNIFITTWRAVQLPPLGNLPSSRLAWPSLVLSCRKWGTDQGWTRSVTKRCSARELIFVPPYISLGCTGWRKYICNSFIFLKKETKSTINWYESHYIVRWPYFLSI